MASQQKILYYSKQNDICKRYIPLLQRNGVPAGVNFVCVDGHISDSMGRHFAILANGQQFPIPPSITNIPALFILPEQTVILGESAFTTIMPMQGMPMQGMPMQGQMQGQMPMMQQQQMQQQQIIPPQNGGMHMPMQVQPTVAPIQTEPASFALGSDTFGNADVIGHADGAHAGSVHSSSYSYVNEPPQVTGIQFGSSTTIGNQGMQMQGQQMQGQQMQGQQMQGQNPFAQRDEMVKQQTDMQIAQAKAAREAEDNMFKQTYQNQNGFVPQTQVIQQPFRGMQPQQPQSHPYQMQQHQMPSPHLAQQPMFQNPQQQYYTQQYQR